MSGATAIAAALAEFSPGELRYLMCDAWYMPRSVSIDGITFDGLEELRDLHRAFPAGTLGFPGDSFDVVRRLSIALLARPNGAA